MDKNRSGWVPTDTLANRLRLMRHQLHLSQRKAAEISGVTFGEWQSMEDGRDARGVPQKVQAISAALGVDRDWLLWGGPLDQGEDDDPDGHAALPTIPKVTTPKVVAVGDPCLPHAA